jgi:hypothetical protein
MSFSPTPPTPPAQVVTYRTHPPIYPICPWDLTEEALRVDTDVLGSAFFISDDGGVFITARHVVDSYLDQRNLLRVLHVDDPPTRVTALRVVALQAHPAFDVAIGQVQVPAGVFLQRLILREGELASGEPIAIFGFAGTTVGTLEPSEPGGFPHLRLDMNPQFYQGRIDAFHPHGFGLARDPVYLHTAETTGGISGGPLLRLADSGVYGITSTGSIAYGTAVDIRVILDWPVGFLGGRTLRQVAAETSSAPERDQTG